MGIRRAGREPVAPREGIRRGRELIRTAIATAGIELPDEMKRAVFEPLDFLEAVIAGEAPMPSGPAPLFHCVVLWLLNRNFIIAAEEVDRDAAAQQLKASVRQLTKKPRGRAPATPHAA
jgi:hypothetical protein